MHRMAGKRRARHSVARTLQGGIGRMGNCKAGMMAVAVRRSTTDRHLRRCAIGSSQRGGAIADRPGHAHHVCPSLASRCPSHPHTIFAVHNESGRKSFLACQIVYPARSDLRSTAPPRLARNCEAVACRTGQCHEEASMIPVTEPIRPSHVSPHMACGLETPARMTVATQFKQDAAVRRLEPVVGTSCFHRRIS